MMNESRIEALHRVEEALGYRFNDIGLLDNALTHRSFVNENPGLARGDNERLEFLGDAVLELTISDMLMRRFPDHSEGQLSKMRASVVNERPLAELAGRYGIGESLLLGRGEEASGGRRKPSLLANAFESVIAALYLDGGFDRTSAFVGRLFTPLIGEGDLTAVYRDYKTAVQEVCQVRFKEVPRYEVVSETGPDHDKRFETGLVIGQRIIAKGVGRNKKEAEQQAARTAMEILVKSPPPGADDPAGSDRGGGPEISPAEPCR